MDLHFCLVYLVKFCKFLFSRTFVKFESLPDKLNINRLPPLFYVDSIISSETRNKNTMSYFYFFSHELAPCSTKYLKHNNHFASEEHYEYYFEIPLVPSRNDSIFCGYKGLFDYFLTKDINKNLDRSLFVIFFLLGTLVGLMGSALILLGIKQKAFRLDKVITTLILHIAVVDILTTCILIFPTFLTASTDRWLFGEKFCVLQGYARWFLTSCSGFLVCTLNCSKVARLHFPFRAATWTSKRGHILAGGMIILSGTVVAIFFLRAGGQYINTIFIYYQLSCDVTLAIEIFRSGAVFALITVLLCSILTLISCIWLIIIAVKMSIQNGRRANLRGIVTVISISVIYFISYMPLFGYFLNKAIGKYVGVYTEIVCVSFTCLNNIANVFIYMVSLTSFRKFVKAQFSVLFSSLMTRPMRIWRLITGRGEQVTPITEQIQPTLHPVVHFKKRGEVINMPGDTAANTNIERD